METPPLACPLVLFVLMLERPGQTVCVHLMGTGGEARRTGGWTGRCE